MKLKSVLLGLAAAGTLMTASAAMAEGSFILHNDAGVLNISVTCPPGKTTPTVAYSVPYSALEKLFMGGATSATCTFTNTVSGTVLGTGHIAIASGNATATLTSVKPGAGYKVVVNGKTNPSSITEANMDVTVEKA